MESPNLANQSRQRERLTILLAYLVFAALYLGTPRFIDPDLWHQMALVRESIAEGRLLTSDPFAYTPTVEPMVHHEWGTGVILYFVYTTLGAPGLVILREVLAIGIAIGCLLCARARGARHAVLWPLLPVAIFLMWPGLTLVRAQMLTLMFLAWLLWLLEVDRSGRRWWIVPWLVIYVIWLNVHAGFVVGLIAFCCYGFEQVVKRRPVGRLVAVGLAMAALVVANPYGTEYYSYLVHALRMERPLITEWRSMVHAWPPLIGLYAFSLLLIAYCLYRNGLKSVFGIVFLLAAAYAAARHQRHVTLYAVAWVCFVPAMIQTTPLGAFLNEALAPRRRAVRITAAVAAVIALGVYIYNGPWKPILPETREEHPLVVYPVRAVEYLRANDFRGNLLTPFTAGAFVSWHLYPDVLVSMDGRYEVAYPPDLLDEHVEFFNAGPGWEDFLERYPTDAVLTRSGAAIIDRLAEHPGWRMVYRDDGYEIYARDRFDLPEKDRRSE